MESHVNQSPAIPKWSTLLIEAVTKPGLIMKAYSAFHKYPKTEQHHSAEVSLVTTIPLRLTIAYFDLIRPVVAYSLQ